MKVALFKALAAAGGPGLYSRLKDSVLVRDGKRHPLDLRKHTPETDLLLQPEDQLIIPES